MQQSDRDDYANKPGGVRGCQAVILAQRAVESRDWANSQFPPRDDGSLQPDGKLTCKNSFNSDQAPMFVLHQRRDAKQSRRDSNNGDCRVEKVIVVPAS